MFDIEKFEKNQFNEYQNSHKFYDLDFTGKAQDDIQFYITLIKGSYDNVLELCCGSGRVSIPLAENGITVTALDISSEMLCSFQHKLDRATISVKNKINLVKGDLATFSLQRKFKCIVVPYRSFLCLTDNREILRSLNNIRQHLVEDGIFILNIFKPLDDLKDTEGQWETKNIYDSEKKLLYERKCTNTYVDTQNQIIYYELHYHMLVDNIPQVIIDYMRVKYFYLSQLTELLMQNGFVIQKVFYGFDGSEKDNNHSSDITIVCKKSK